MLLCQWSEWQDSNLRPSAPKADALPACATLRCVSRAGLEPAKVWYLKPVRLPISPSG
jgi:hypothetical protein